jgi:hypothetical protein
MDIASELLCWLAHAGAYSAQHLHIDLDELQVSYAKLVPSQPCRVVISSIASPGQIKKLGRDA